MPRSKSDAERILTYFKMAPIGEAKLLLDLAWTEVKLREAGTPQAVPAKPRGRRSANSVAHDAEAQAQQGSLVG
jgi:hypothetical protein